MARNLVIYVRRSIWRKHSNSTSAPRTAVLPEEGQALLVWYELRAHKSGDQSATSPLVYCTMCPCFSAARLAPHHFIISPARNSPKRDCALSGAPSFFSRGVHSSAASVPSCAPAKTILPVGRIHLARRMTDACRPCGKTTMQELLYRTHCVL